MSDKKDDKYLALRERLERQEPLVEASLSYHAKREAGIVPTEKEIQSHYELRQQRKIESRRFL